MLKRRYFSIGLYFIFIILTIKGVSLWLTPFLLGIFLFSDIKSKYIVIILLFLLFFRMYSFEPSSNYSGTFEVKNHSSIKYLKVIESSGKYFMLNSRALKNGIYSGSFKAKKHRNIRADGYFINEFYYKSNGIIAEAYDFNLEKVKDLRASVRDKLKDYFYDRLKNYKNRDLVYAILFGSREFIDRDTNELLGLVGIMHIFVLSGFHVRLIERNIRKIFYFFRIPNFISDIFILLLLFMICYMTNFHVSSLRAMIVVIIEIIFFYKKISLNHFDVAGICTIIIMLINPYSVISLSFMMGMVGYLSIRSFKNNSILMLYIFLIPFLSMQGFEYSVVLFIFSIFISYILSNMILFLYISLFVFPVAIFLNKVFVFVEFLINAVYKIPQLKLVILSFNTVSLSIYILGVVFLLHLEELQLNINLKKASLIIISLIMLSQIFYAQSLRGSIHIINVGQGNSQLIITETGKKILYDTGNRKSILKYLRRMGVSKLDAIFLSHLDDDHSAMVDYLRYDKLYTSHPFVGHKSFYLKSGDNVWLDDVNLKVVHPHKIGKSMNKKSMVISTKVQDRTILMTGDIDNSHLMEFDLTQIFMYPHHGSKYSLSFRDLKRRGQGYVIISYGRNNYGHPSQKLIEFLNRHSIKYFETFYDSNIIFTKKSIRFK